MFFDSNENFCIPPKTSPGNRPKYLLARQVIIRHLCAHLPNDSRSTKVYRFESIHDAKFQKYLQENGTYFIMCHDAATPDRRVGLYPEIQSTEASDTPSDGVEMLRKTALRTMICTFVSHGYNVALVNGLEWHDTKVSSASCSPCEPPDT